ncbi:MAG: hypothetical protein OHK0012_10310 [Synechococcales cyanobacterium]
MPSTGVGINSISFEVIVKPSINEKHIFEGEVVIGSGGNPQAVGFHSRPGGVDPSTARIRLKSDGTPVFGLGPNSKGIYTRVIDVWDLSTNEWIPKDPYSSFFPDSWDRNTVIEEVLKAFSDIDLLPQTQDQEVTVPTLNGFEIEFKYDKQKNLIRTVYPIYVP